MISEHTGERCGRDIVAENAGVHHIFEQLLRVYESSWSNKEIGRREAYHGSAVLT